MNCVRRKTAIHTFAIVMLLVALVVPLASGAARAQPREKIAIGAVDNLVSALPMVAVSQGFYAKHGLDVELKLYRSGQELAKALVAGDVTFGTSAMNNLQAEIQAGLDNVAYILIMGDGASLDNDRPLAIVAAPGTGIQKPEDLRGKTIGLSLGGTAELYLRAVLERAGLTDRDVRMVQVLPANSAQALMTRQVDAISAWEPWPTQALAQVPGAVEVARGGGHFSYVVFGLVRPQTLKERPDLVKREIMAKAEAAQWLRQNPEEAAQALTTWLPGLTPELLAEGLKNVPFDIRITEYTKASWDLSAELLSKWGRLRGTIDIDNGMVNTQLLNEVIAEHPEWFDDLPEVELLDLP